MIVSESGEEGESEGEEHCPAADHCDSISEDDDEDGGSAEDADEVSAPPFSPISVVSVDGCATEWYGYKYPGENHHLCRFEHIPDTMNTMVEMYNKKFSNPQYNSLEFASWLLMKLPFSGWQRAYRTAIFWCYSLQRDGLPFPATLEQQNTSPVPVTSWWRCAMCGNRSQPSWNKKSQKKVCKMGNWDLESV